MEFKDKKVLVAGLGISGKGAVALLQNQGADIFLYDSNTKADVSFFENKKKVFLGEFNDKILDEIEYLILSPGMSVNIDFAVKAKEKGVKVIGELELAYLVSNGKIAAITGTNGKTTTTALVGEILEGFYKDVFVVGNIGKSFASVALETTPDSVIIAEVSSFQLETTDEFKPDVSAVLNLTPDHLDRHGDMENYLDTKMNIAKKQTDSDICILNYDDPYLKEAAKKLNCKVLFFSCSEKTWGGMYLCGEEILYDSAEGEKILCNVKELKILGKHNYENAMAASLIAISMGVSFEIVRKNLLDFKAIEHRIEYVDEKNDIVFYNDSKGTNPDASEKAVLAMERPTVLIAGGYDKSSEFGDWANSFGDKIKCLVLLGQTKYKIEEAVRKTGFENIIIVETFEEAFEEALKNAEPGYAVLLSPACASWGMFKDYEERGNIFKEFVKQL